MANFGTCLLLQRIVYPLLLTGYVLFRPLALSIPHLILLLYLPFVPIATLKTIRGHTGYYFKLAIALTTLVVCTQIGFQIALAALGEDFIQQCQFLEYLFRHIGLIKLNRMSVLSLLLWYLPDFVIFVSTIVLFVLIRKLAIGRVPETHRDGLSVEPTSLTVTTESEDYSPQHFSFLQKIGVFVSLLSLLMAATLRPSVPGGIYFLVFLAAATWWACLKTLGRGFAIVCRILLVFLAVHFTTFLSYQTPWPQEYFPANSTLVRFLGFCPLIQSNCDEPDKDIRIITYNETVEVDSYLNPVAIILCYYTLAIVSGFILNTKKSKGKRDGGAFGQLENGARRISRQVPPKLKQKSMMRKRLARDTWHGAADKVRDPDGQDNFSEPNERTPLMRRSMRRLKNFKQQNTIDSTDTGAIPLDEIAGDTNNFAEEEQSPTICEHIWFGLEQFAEFLFKNSYILSNIVMMVWSIVYHSWLTFIFLLWANLLWIIPNQRKNMFRCSPFVVFYAEFLLLAQYIYGMDLTEDELPSVVDMKGINMAQIGFVRYPEYPCGALLLKTLFTITFWITLRQMRLEAKLERQTSTLAHLAAPFQLTVGAATTDMGRKSEEKKSKFLIQAGIFLKSFLLQLWIWIVVLALFLCAIYGSRITLFRITYMTLFLTFLITLQLSWRLWKKIMYAFWVTVIGFAMLTLIMIYTYQFDRFNEYWANYTMIPEDLQKDIGLEKYATKDLFLHLANPTLVVIITVVQLQIFHQKYLRRLDLPQRTKRDNSDPNNDDVRNPSSSINYGTLEAESITIGEDEVAAAANKEKKVSMQEIRGVTLMLLKSFYIKAKWFLEVAWIFLELHMIKGILIYGFYVGIEHVSVLHISIVVLASIAVTAKSYIQTVFSRLISLVVSILLISKMIYQIQYIDHSKFDVNCNQNNYNNTTTNNPNDADWFGFNKLVDTDESLAQFFDGYIIYIILATVHTVILLRQKRKRFAEGKPLTRPKIIFPGVQRQDADKNLPNMLKYLFNYAYYKFGIEVTLVMLVSLIAVRMDAIALIYSFWLLILFLSSREAKARIWLLFTWFIMIFTILQYVIVVGLPPSICFVFPWDTSFLQQLKEWAWLPDPDLKLQVGKLMTDFLLLIFACRQLQVFRIEQHCASDGTDYPGGNNKSVVNIINNLSQSPVVKGHDFVTFTRNWLDIIKCGVLLSFFWITLAIVFLAGTNRVNLFSLGYLIGSFMFLWQGNDFYLRPIYGILKSWRCLIGYNIFVICIKCLLQIPACIFIQNLENVCWLIHLLGISCIRKFQPHSEIYVVNQCEVPIEDVGLVWDTVCFTFLIFQLRLFKSYYFCHIINESKASTILASRGAELIDALRKKQVKLQAEREEEILGKIKKKMEKIKANQQKLQPALMQPKTHFQETSPMKRTASLSSCAGYHTPIEDEVAGEGVSELPSDLGPLTPYGGSVLTTQAPSPSSAVMTVSLEGYLEPKRLSYGSPPSSELLPRQLSSDESFPVFSPAPNVSQEQSITQSATVPTAILRVSPTNNTLNPVSTTDRQHQRQSSLNTVSWTDQGESSVSNGRMRPSSIPQATTSNVQPIRNVDDDDEVVVLRRRSTSHRRRSSLAPVSWLRTEEERRRRSGYSTWGHNITRRPSYGVAGLADEEDATSRTGSRTSRPFSWGPIGEYYFRESLTYPDVEMRSPVSHQEYQTDSTRPKLERLVSHPGAVRSGDYYLFHDLDEKVELDLIHERASSTLIEDSESMRKFATKLTAEQVLKNRLKQQRRKQSEVNLSHDARRPSLPVYLTESAIDPRTTLSEPINTADGQISATTVSPTKKHEDYTQPDGQQPGTSKGDLGGGRDDLSEPTETADGTSEDQSILAFISAFLMGILVSITVRLYKFSRNYRYVMKVLSKEKRELKAEKDFGQGHRIGSGSVWSPMPSVLRTKGRRSSHSSDDDSGALSTQRISDNSNTNDIITENGTTQPNDDISKELVKSQDVDPIIRDESTTIAHLLRPTMFSTKEKKPIEVEDDRRTSIVPEIRILAPSMERGLDDNSHKTSVDLFDLVDSLQDISNEDDFYSQDHSIITEFITSLWFAIISNTDFVCYLLVFINMVASASVLALPMPILVFLWGTLSIPRPSKAFWVTLIAYIQMVVLIKCISQFDMLWWNSDPLTPNQPLAPARIIGLERNPNYAAYDLALLMVIFFHRFVQKQMGIWRTSLTDDTTLDEGTYALKTELKLNNENGESLTMVQQGNVTVSLKRVDNEVEARPNEELVRITHIQEEPSNYFPAVAALSTQKYCSPCRNFFLILVKHKNRVKSDVYVWIFICDFINFFVLLFGFAAFGSSQGDGGVTSYLQENKIPVTFLVMLLLQFVFIIVDRALYLRKNLVGKIVFQFVSVIGMHIWLFFLVPMFSERSFNAKLPPVIYYIIKCFYFLLSAYQIRCGYPRRILGNCLTKGYSLFNLGAFKVYMLTPFLFELRTLMDWIWTDSSMPLFEWLKMEDIFANIYEIKCSRQMEKDFPTPRGEAKGPFMKYIMGGGFLFVIIALVWGPLAIFALGNTVGEPNIPTEVSVSLRIGPYEPVYIMSGLIQKFDEEDWMALQKQYHKDRTAVTFLSNYEGVDVAVARLAPNSTSLWNISPPDLNRLKENLANNDTLRVKFTYTVERVTYSEAMQARLSADQSYDLLPNTDERADLLRSLEGNSSYRVLLPKLFPKFIKVKNIGGLKTIPQLMEGEDELRNLSLRLYQTNTGELNYWWEILEDCSDKFYKDVISRLPFANCVSDVVIYTFSDKLFPEKLSFITAGGVLGIYSTFVFLASRIFRGMFSGGSQNIIYSELPYVDRILQLCLDIYLVRESMEFSLEEDLFAKLIFLYRSPETLIKWTRPLEEQSDDEDEIDDSTETVDATDKRRSVSKKND